MFHRIGFWVVMYHRSQRISFVYRWRLVLVAQVAARGAWGTSTKSLWQPKNGKRHKLRSDKNFLLSQNILVLNHKNLVF